MNLYLFVDLQRIVVSDKEIGNVEEREGHSKLLEQQLNAKDPCPQVEHIKETCRSCLSEERIAKYSMLC